MLVKRIIACLDVKGGRTVKGTRFLNLRDAGDPVELACEYCRQEVDELVFLDITATNEKRKTLTSLVKRVAKNINIPFTVGGGINSIEDIEILLSSGADKVSINTYAVRNPLVITESAKRFGTQCIVVAIDAKRVDGDYKVFLNGGREATTIDAVLWAKRASELGAGEILLTSMDTDGTKLGFDIELTRLVSESVKIPVIASGGAGKIEHFEQVFKQGKADAALAASIFHFREVDILQLKKYLLLSGIEVRLTEAFLDVA
ncbi:MAG: imidazole glycerol phosphate synthase subunit HisF [Pyrinomonadaceae bacterium]|nr:imidazole glycerol phosphate synthase subunit HisF [Pyrinomonadaceae bacterium]MCX7639485.1 imidazole glycerol phosphate synthase subunit HisF [Pyrinomonadaceae bacterium]MDW8304464.1 imidazole glycerol phosphate synthase subunit HisF [Acidobacteriota bacterium]